MSDPIALARDLLRCPSVTPAEGGALTLIERVLHDAGFTVHRVTFEEPIAVNGTIKLLKWAAEGGEKFDHCILGEPTNPQALGDMIKIGRRGSQNGTLIVTGTQGHVAYPELADNPVRGITTIMGAIN